MSNLPTVNTDQMVKFLVDLLNTPSPTGYTEQAISFIDQALKAYPFLELTKLRKGGLLAKWPGDREDAPRALTAHTDTLGAMVKEIKSNGRLRMTKIGGYSWNTVEGEGVTIHTQSGETFRGTILIDKASTHVHGAEVTKRERSDDNMEIRLDVRTASLAETAALGIEVGDFVILDPRVELNNGFIRSRHLDDKACVANILGALQAMKDAGLKPVQTTYLLFSNYEEVGHGASAGIPSEVGELVTLDMAAIGTGQTSTEFHATLCVKDSGGPYHHGLSNKLRKLASEFAIPYKVDIYPYYGSDGEAFWRAGGDLAVALIGPGVDASHNCERTHIDAIVATTNWVLAYLLDARESV